MNTNGTPAKYEGGDAAHAIHALGLDLNELSKMDSADAFVAISEQVRKLPNEYAKARVAEEIFGRSGIEMLALLKLSAADYNAALGKALTSGEAQSGAGVAAAEQMAAQWRDAKGAIAGTWTELGGKLAPALEFVGWLAEKIGHGFKYVFDLAYAGIGSVLLARGKLIEGLVWVVVKIGEIGSKLPAALGGDAFKSIQGGAEAAKDFAKGFNDEVGNRVLSAWDSISDTWNSGAAAGKFGGTKTAGAPTESGLFGGAVGHQSFSTEALSRVSSGIPTVGGRQEVHDPIATRHLETIARNTARPTVAIAGR